jgi:hypothetical protein
LSSRSIRLILGASALSLLVSMAPNASSMPRLMDLYNAHPRSLAQNREKCVICHTNADGSGKLSAFGHKYEDAGLEFTDALLKEYPNLFSAASGDSAASAGVSSSSNPGPPAESKAADAPPAPAWNCHGKLGDGDPLQGVPAWATKKWLETRSPQKTELVNIILKGKDKMIGHAGKITEAQAIELYVLIVEIAKKNS